MQSDVAGRNAAVDAWNTNLGANPHLRLYNGTIPATVATALSGNTQLATGQYTGSPYAAASGGVANLAGNWVLTGSAAGTVTWWAIFASDGTTRKRQGPVSELGMNNTTVAVSQTITVTALPFTMGNA